MKFSSLLSVIALVSVPVFGAKVTFDTNYDNPRTSLTAVACSNGPNGLITKGYTTLGSLPKFPYIGGVPAVRGWNSPNCGTCWQLSYKGRSIHVLAVDTSATYNIGSVPFGVLAGGGTGPGVLNDVVAKQVPNHVCGLN